MTFGAPTLTFDYLPGSKKSFHWRGYSVLTGDSNTLWVYTLAGAREWLNVLTPLAILPVVPTMWDEFCLHVFVESDSWIIKQGLFTFLLVFCSVYQSLRMAKFCGGTLANCQVSTRCAFPDDYSVSSPYVTSCGVCVVTILNAQYFTLQRRRGTTVANTKTIAQWFKARHSFPSLPSIVYISWVTLILHTAKN